MIEKHFKGKVWRPIIEKNLASLGINFRVINISFLFKIYEI